MISKGSCDTEDWNNDAENLALPLQEYLPNIVSQISYFKLKIKYCCFYCIFYQINAALLNIGDFFQKHLKKSYHPQSFGQ